MRTKLLFALILSLFYSLTYAQRFTDNLDRGLTVLPRNASRSQVGIYVTWRRLAHEYYDVTYNLYKNGSLLASNLTKQNYEDVSGKNTDVYTVAAVVNGVVQSQCTGKSQGGWLLDTNGAKTVSSARYGAYLAVSLNEIWRNGTNLTANYSNNDAEFADLDGDGELEMLIKRRSLLDNDANYVSRTDGAYDVFEAYDINYQSGAATLLWWIDAGPNMVSGGSHEFNLIAYDWDEDGKAEVVLRGADGMVIHYGTNQTRVIGNASIDTRNTVTHTANATYTNTGDEFLIYMAGDTGAPYQVITYPLERGNEIEWTPNGGIWGHRSSKYFYGAPFLDGRKASLFLGRGIYTQHKMCAMDLDRSNHTWSTRWTWSNNTAGSPWYGQGNHNYTIADVDWDGRDEIVYGSMVIDDNGKGLSTTGLGHGDAIHVGDFDPFKWGQEVFACNEDNPGNNYRNGTTSEIYYRNTAGEDDGRALMDNFTNAYPGSVGRSVSSGMISSVTNSVVSELGDLIAWNDLNFRIYWDGDLLSEVLNSPGNEKAAKVDKPGSGRLLTSMGNVNNSTKNHPCFSGDLFGDWREEIVLRYGNDIIIYSTTEPTEHGIYSLWFDHQYRQAMGWQMMAYNQPPHPSFFLGELEDITMAPPPLSNRGKTEIANNDNITSAHDGKDLLVCVDGVGVQYTINYSGNVAPHTLTINTPRVVSGQDREHEPVWQTENSCVLSPSSAAQFTGGMRLVKQGQGMLAIRKTTLANTGQTDLWEGTIIAPGVTFNNKVWMNRHTNLWTGNTNFNGGLEMNYNSYLNIESKEGDDFYGAVTSKVGSISVSNLVLNYGSRIVVDVNSSENAALNDQVNISGDLTINKKSWLYGPEFSAPVIQYVGTLTNGRYRIGTVGGNIVGNLKDIILVGDNSDDVYLAYGNPEIESDKGLYLVVTTGQRVTEDSYINDIALTNMLPTSAPYYMPEVTISTTGSGSLATRFVSADGEGNSFAGTLYNENYKITNPATVWNMYDANVFKDGEKGARIDLNTGKNSRNAYTLFGGIDGLDFSGVKSYIVELDMCFHAGSQQASEFVVMANGCIIPSNKNSGFSFNQDKTNAAGSQYLFKLRSTDEARNNFYINDTESYVTMNNWGIHHIKLEIDTEARTAKYTISAQKAGWDVAQNDVAASGTFNIPTGTRPEAYGLFVLNGRSSTDGNPSSSVFHNIKIYTDNNLYYDEEGYSHANGNQGGSRYGYKEFENIDVARIDIYNIEFDAKIKAGENSGDNQFAITSTNSTYPSRVYDPIDDTKCIFSMKSPAKSQTYTILDNTQITLDANVTYHYSININTENKRVQYTIKNGETIEASGSYDLPSAASTAVKGVYSLDGRYAGQTSVSNILITQVPSNVFRFTKPGTLTAYMIEEGMKPSEAKTYSVRAPYAILYESPAYNKISKESVASTLGSKLWNDSYSVSRWANWSQTNATYGANYQMVTSKSNSNSGIIYVDKDSILTTNYVGGSTPLTLIEGFGIGHNGNSTATIIKASNLGDASTIVYYKADNSRGGTTNYDEGYTCANADGSFSYTTNPVNATFCKLIAYVPIDEEYEELATMSPTAFGDGGVLLNRVFSADANTLSGSTWSTIVLPFSMNEQQILATFGAGTMVGNMVVDDCTSNTLVFNTDIRKIVANQPCIIRVGKIAQDDKYVFAGVTRLPGESPVVSSEYYDFIGTYKDEGTLTLPENTYFFNSKNTYTLSKVAKVNNTRLKGFRAYFQSKDANAGTVNVKFVGRNIDDEDDEETYIMTPQGEIVKYNGNVYTITGVLVREGDSSLEGLPKGIYVVNGRKVLKSK